MPSSRAKGQQAEDIAAGHAVSLGWQVLCRNFRSRRGEVDLILAKDGILVFAEVKSIDAYGPESLARTVNAVKRRRIVETSKLYLCTYREYTYSVIRYDVIAVRALRVEAWLESAFAE